MTHHNRMSSSPPAERSPSVGSLRNSLISTLMLLAGIWLFVGAWVIDYPFNEPAVDAHLQEMIVGVIVFLVAVARFVRPSGTAPDLIVLLAGAWLVAAPFVLSYGDTSKADAARFNNVTVGTLLILLAVVSLLLAQAEKQASPNKRSL